MMIAAYRYRNKQIEFAYRDGDSSFELLFFGAPFLGDRLIGRAGKDEARVVKLEVMRGSDVLGDYERVVIDFESDKTSARTFTGAVRFYEDFLIFEVTNHAELTAKKNKHLFGHPFLSFPSFEGSQWQDGLSMLSYKRQAPFNYPEQWQGTVAADALRSGKNAPLLVTNSHYQTVVLSPLNHLLYGTVSISKQPEAVRCGLPRALNSIPAGTNYETILVYGKGATRTMQRYGELLRLRYGTQPIAPQADVSLRSISYWTNAGSAYWYRAYKRNTYEDTLRKLRAHHEKIGLPIGLYQLDSWWYKRDGNDYISSITEWEPKPEVEAKNFNSMLPFMQKFRLIRLFSQNRMSAVQALLNRPLGTHFKQISSESPYTEQFEFIREQFAVPRNYEQALHFFRHIFDHPKWRLSLIIHDWLHLMGLGHSAFRDIEAGPDYFRALDDALRATPAPDNEEGHLTLQLCMQLPSMTLLSSAMPSVTSLRSTSDSNSFLIEGGRRWWWHLYSSLFINAMGKYGFLDNRFTYKSYLWPFSPYSKFEFIWMALGCGPIGIGDPIGKENMQLIRRVIDARGDIIKPERPCIPLDQAFLHNPGAFSATRGVTVYSSDSVGGHGKAYYLLTFNCQPFGRKVEMSYALSELDDLAPSRYIMYDYFARTATVTDEERVHVFKLARRAFYYHIATPLVEGRAFLGDVSKHVALSRQIVRNCSIESRRVHLTLSYAEGSHCQLLLYSDEKPVEVWFGSSKLAERKGQEKSWSYNGKTSLVSIYNQDIHEGIHEIWILYA